MFGYSSHGYISTLAAIKELELERGNEWFDDHHLDGEKTLAVWVTKNAKDALRYVFASDIEDQAPESIERRQYEMALSAPEDYVEKVELEGWEEVLGDGDGGFLYIKPSRKFVSPDPIGMLADLEISHEQAGVGKMVKPTSLVNYLGGKKKWIEVFEEDLLPLLHAKIGKPYAFLDCFGGSGIVSYTFAMSDFGGDVRKVYYNDLNQQMVDLLTAVKTKEREMLQVHPSLINLFSKDPTEAGFQNLKRISDEDPDISRRAVAYIMRMKVSYMGKGSNIPKQLETIEGSLKKTINALDSLDDWHEAFRDAQIWHGSFEKAIDRFEKAEASPRVIFCDPPYLGHKASEQYQAGFEHGLHDTLVERIKNRTSTYVLTHSYTPEFKELYGPLLKTRDWHEDIDVRYGNRGDGERQHETLSVWFAKGTRRLK